MIASGPAGFFSFHKLLTAIPSHGVESSDTIANEKTAIADISALAETHLSYAASILEIR